MLFSRKLLQLLAIGQHLLLKKKNVSQPHHCYLQFERKEAGPSYNDRHERCDKTMIMTVQIHAVRVQGDSCLVLLGLFSLSPWLQMLIWLAARWRRGRSDPLTFVLMRHAGLPPSFCQRPFKDVTGWWWWWEGEEPNIKQVLFPARAEPLELEAKQTNKQTAKTNRVIARQLV